ncbi:MAG: DUF1559 domain-containing protein [Gemmataceae bacterium]|nr:DUF1559 domain-containing protein [Gemmataceae bacterium]
MSRSFKCFLFGLIGVIGCCVLLPMPDDRGATQEAFFFGWLIRIRELLTEYDADWVVIAMVMGAIGITIAVVHAIGSWCRGFKGWSRKRSLAVIGLLTMLALAGIAMVNLTHNAAILFDLPHWQIDHSAARTRKLNNIKNIGLGLFGHHDAEKQFPPGGTFDANGRALHGWQTMILPHIDQAPLYQQINLCESWASPRHLSVFTTPVAIYGHPLAEEHNAEGYALMSYAGNVHVLGGKPMKLAAITDGAANTILLGEVAHNLKPWGMPMNSRDPSLGLKHPEGFGGKKGGGVAFAMADGSVRWLAKDTDPEILKALATPNGGEGAKAHEIPD